MANTSTALERLFARHLSAKECVAAFVILRKIDIAKAAIAKATGQ